MEFLEKIKDIITKFTKSKVTLAIAESCTGGYISNMFTNISGASKVFERGIICYSNASKVALANNIRVLSNVDIGIGITGIAGPTGGTPEKPVGLVYIGISNFDVTFVEKYHFNVDRITFKTKILEKILLLLQNYIK